MFFFGLIPPRDFQQAEDKNSRVAENLIDAAYKCFHTRDDEWN